MDKTPKFVLNLPHISLKMTLKLDFSPRILASPPPGTPYQTKLHVRYCNEASLKESIS